MTRPRVEWGVTHDSVLREALPNVDAHGATAVPTLLSLNLSQSSAGKPASLNCGSDTDGKATSTISCTTCPRIEQGFHIIPH